jgi:hypothetical protein
MEAASHLREHLPADCAAWLDSYGADVQGAWSVCPKAEWLLSMALAVGIERRLVVHAAHDLASAAIAKRADAGSSARRALELALEWTEGRATPPAAGAAACWAAAAADRCDADAELSSVVRAAAFVAFACDDLADATFYLHRSYASKAAELAVRVCGVDARWAEGVRSRISLEQFSAAYALASEPPEAQPDLDPGDSGESFYT